MSANVPITAGIPPANRGALQVLQFTQPGARSVEQDVHGAAEIVSTYQRPNEVAVRRHEAIARAAAEFLVAIVDNTPSGPERSTAISRAREARMWANAAVALDGK